MNWNPVNDADKKDFDRNVLQTDRDLKALPHCRMRILFLMFCGSGVDLPYLHLSLS